MSPELSRNSWSLDITECLIEGRDGEIWGERLGTSWSNVERPTQHLYPLELSSNREEMRGDATILNPAAAGLGPDEMRQLLLSCECKNWHRRIN